MKKRSIWKHLDINGESNCFFRLKNHEENFTSNPTARTLNPAQSKLGKMSKMILDRINVKTVQCSTSVNRKLPNMS